jgi:phosphoserine phosphatase RsbU/P
MEIIQCKFRQTARNVFDLLTELIPAKSFFIASTTENRFIILEMFNHVGGCPIPPDVNEPLQISYCQHVATDAVPLLIPDTRQSSPVKELEVTSLLSIGSYLGVPIFLEDGSVFGTLCALDPRSNILFEEHIAIMEKFSKVISGSIELEQSLIQLKENEIRTEREFHIARNLQTAMFCKPMSQENVSIEPLYLPCSYLSGDVFTWKKLGEGKYGIAILDVMGHDTSSALVGMMVFSHLKNQQIEYENPYQVMSSLNQKLTALFNENINNGMYVTGIYVEVNLTTMELIYMNAGHPAAVLIEKNEATLLSQSTVPLGLLDKLEDTRKTVSISKDFQLLLYTDGLLDCFQNTDLSKLETLRLKIEESLYLKESISGFLEKVTSNQDKQVDDICVLTVRCTGRLRDLA